MLAFTAQIKVNMDRQISEHEQSKDKKKTIINVLLFILLICAAYYFLRHKLQKKGDRKDFHIVNVEKGNLRATLSAAGTVVAASERVINAPVSTEIEDVLLSTGSAVTKGDLILRLDKEYTKLEYEKLQDELSLKKNNVHKLKLQFDKDLRDIDYLDQIKALQLSELRAQLGDQERLHKIGGATEEEVEAAKLKLSTAQIEKKVLENDLTFKREVNSTDKDNLQLEIDIQVKRLRELKRKLEETQVKSPQEGVITWINENIGKTVSVGEPLVKIANLNRYKVEATTSDRNSKELNVGLTVEVRIGKDRLKGQITRILPEIVNNTVSFFIALEDNDHESLRPNLRTEIYIITDEKSNVLKAKRGSGLKGTKSQYIYKVEGGVAQKVRVTKGLVSSEYFEIEEGLSEGDKIIISETEDFDHMVSFTINK
jgi:HlyD family secretion protein